MCIYVYIYIYIYIYICICVYMYRYIYIAGGEDLVDGRARQLSHDSYRDTHHL